MSARQSGEQYYAHRPDSTYTQTTRHTTDPLGSSEAIDADQYEQTTPQQVEDINRRSASTSSTRVDPSSATTPRSDPLRNKPSGRRRASVSRRSSRRSVRAGSMRGIGTEEDGYNNVFNIPIPTTGNPTETLANRFQAWRRLLKDLITFYREIQASYELRSKALLKLSNVISNTRTPTEFVQNAGLDVALGVLRNYHKLALAEANKARDIEDDVITQLNGLRGDLNQKIKEIKSLSGDFKNSVEKERDGTRRAVDHLKDALALAETDPAAASGKGDPFIVRLAVDRQVEKQIDEENYLHRAYLNLEGSGRELEAIIVGEIQKAYNAYSGILKREAEYAQDTVDQLRTGPVATPKDFEWDNFIQKDHHFVKADMPLRKLENIHYPGKFTPAAAEVRGGNLERKSKYLKSYTPGWYVLSPTHIHEFKSADHIQTQSPVMSLYLMDQKLGSHSQPGASSYKFSLKGRQTGSMHRGHAWVFRAESYDTMLAWYEDIKFLTEKTGEEKMAFLRKHARSLSGASKVTAESEDVGEDETDTIPYAAQSPPPEGTVEALLLPAEAGRPFPSDLDASHDPEAPFSSSIADTTFRHDQAEESPPVDTAHSTQDISRDNQDSNFRGEYYAPVLIATDIPVAPELSTGLTGSVLQGESQTDPHQVETAEAHDYTREQAAPVLPIQYGWMSGSAIKPQTEPFQGRDYYGERPTSSLLVHQGPAPRSRSMAQSDLVQKQNHYGEPVRSAQFTQRSLVPWTQSMSQSDVVQRPNYYIDPMTGALIIQHGPATNGYRSPSQSSSVYGPPALNIASSTQQFTYPGEREDDIAEPVAAAFGGDSPGVGVLGAEAYQRQEEQQHQDSGTYVSQEEQHDSVNPTESWQAKTTISGRDSNPPVTQLAESSVDFGELASDDQATTIPRPNNVGPATPNHTFTEEPHINGDAHYPETDKRLHEGPKPAEAPSANGKLTSSISGTAGGMYPMFPWVRQDDTSTSVSDLHIPGEYPQGIQS